MKDIRKLASMSPDEKVAIANALNTNPMLSLDGAEKSIKPQDPDQSSSTASAETSSQSSDFRQLLNKIKSRHEADLVQLSNISVEFDATYGEDIPTMIETEKEIITAAQDVIKAAKDTIVALEKIHDEASTDAQ